MGSSYGYWFAGFLVCWSVGLPGYCPGFGNTCPPGRPPILTGSPGGDPADPQKFPGGTIRANITPAPGPGRLFLIPDRRPHAQSPEQRVMPAAPGGKPENSPLSRSHSAIRETCPGDADISAQTTGCGHSASADIQSPVARTAVPLPPAHHDHR